MLRHDGKLELDTVIVDGVQTRAFGGGDRTGPSPVDRRKAGTKYPLMTDRNGVAPAVRIIGANRSDQQQIPPILKKAFHKSGVSRSSTINSSRGA